MTPLTQDPKVIVLVNELDFINKVATNISEDVRVFVTYNPDTFKALSAGMPFQIEVP